MIPITLIYYLLIGTIWGILHEGRIETSSQRIRFILLWPITLIAWIIGFISAMLNQFNDEEM